MDFCCSPEALNWCFCLIICEVVRGCVLTLGIVWRLFFCVSVLDLSLVTVLVFWVLLAHIWEVSEFTTVEAFLSWSFALWSVFVRPWTTEFTCSLSNVPVVLSSGLGPPRLPLWLDLLPWKAPLPLKLCLPHCWRYWASLCTDVLSVQSEDSGYRAWTCLHVTSSVWQILVHSFRVRLYPFEIHCWYAVVPLRPTMIKFLVSLSLQSPTQLKLHRSTTLLTSWIYVD